MPAGPAWPYLIASIATHLLYFALLIQSFRLGDFSQMYPIARGTAPLVVTVLAVLFVGEHLSRWQIAGVALVSGGLSGLALWGMRGCSRRVDRLALAAALGTGLSISAYTVVDGVGVRAAGTAAGYTGWLLLLQGVAVPAFAFASRRGNLAAQLRPVALHGALGGLLSAFAYGLVLWAQSRADLAPVSALRESSIVIGALIGTVFFKERFGRARMLSAALIVAGIGLMLHSG
ncbi:EamA family transporter [Streptomyces sp. IMTB 2501]|nr:EamA family transporter [Streptomyces sp. IMTB 2501]